MTEISAVKSLQISKSLRLDSEALLRDCSGEGAIIDARHHCTITNLTILTIANLAINQDPEDAREFLGSFYCNRRDVLIRGYDLIVGHLWRLREGSPADLALAERVMPTFRIDPQSFYGDGK